MKPQEDDSYVPDTTVWQRFIVLAEELVQLQKDSRALYELFRKGFIEFPTWMEKFKIMNNSILDIEKIPGMKQEVAYRMSISDEMARLASEALPVVQRAVYGKMQFHDYAFSLNDLFNAGVDYIKEKDLKREISSSNRERKLMELKEALEIGKEKYKDALSDYTFIKENLDEQIKLYKQLIN